MPQRIAGRRLYLCTPDRPDLGEFLARCIEGGVDIVQLREKGLDDRPLLERATLARDVCRRYQVPFVLNDRPDLAVACEADGVHVGQDDIGVEQARELLGDGRIIGLSTHSTAQIDSALAAGVDYIGVGPVHATPTKPGRPAVGTELVAYAAAPGAGAGARIPFFAIGGIDRSNVGAVVAAGAERVAVVRAITRSPDPERAARELRAALGGAPGQEVGVGHTARA